NPVYGSFGGRFDPELEIYQWNAIEPESPYYMQRRPWVAAKNGPITFFETPVTYNNSINLSGGTSQGTYRISYTNFDQKGLLPNSSLKRNSFSLNTSHTFFEKLTATATANYVSSSTIGRNETGSDFR